MTTKPCFVIGRVPSCKVSSLADLESELSMPSEGVAAKIGELETRGVFTGITVDDARGGTGSSFVRISDSELHKLAALINERGRLTVAEVAAEANRILQLTESSEEELVDNSHTEHRSDEGNGDGDR